MASGLRGKPILTPPPHHQKNNNATQITLKSSYLYSIDHCLPQNVDFFRSYTKDWNIVTLAGPRRYAPRTTLSSSENDCNLEGVPGRFTADTLLHFGKQDRNS